MRAIVEEVPRGHIPSQYASIKEYSLVSACLNLTVEVVRAIMQKVHVDNASRN